jgi:hypothetical protein
MAELKEDRFEPCTDLARAARAALNVEVSTMAPTPAPSMNETVTGDTGSRSAGVLLFDDFGNPSTGWENVLGQGRDQQSVDGRYQIRSGEAAPPGVFAIATGGATASSSANVAVSARVVILWEARAAGTGSG